MYKFSNSFAVNKTPYNTKDPFRVTQACNSRNSREYEWGDRNGERNYANTY